MPQLLLELFSEEIPARMQTRAVSDLERMLMDALTAAGFLPEGVKAFAAPRRLAAVVEGLPVRTADVAEERKGPRVDAPDAAIQGFLKGAGVTVDQCRKVEDKKGAFWVADIVKPGRPTPDVIAEIVPRIVRSFPWPKSMRWGAVTDDSLSWVRPLHRILCTFDGEVVPFVVDGIASGDVTEGHRFHAPQPISVRRFDDYMAALAKADVVLDREDRKAAILADARTLCHARGFELVEDEGLLDEVCGLVDRPVVLMGDMDPAFLDLPPEVIRLTMRVNQKYFAVRDPATGGLAPHFIVVSNIAAEDGGKAIVHGNGRVLAARLNDARYFWDLDRKTPLEARFEKLKTLVFHEKLGTVADKVERIVALSRHIAPLVGADPVLAERAARLCKCDLATEMVGEFPELQGVMGRYYATLGGETQQVADAIRDHYRPLGPSDEVPTDAVSVAVALADKIDILVGFWAIDEKPTGSKDPYALRRAALGIIRVVQQSNLRLPLLDLYSVAYDQQQMRPATDSSAQNDFLAFFQDRLRVLLREQGERHDVIDAVLALGDDDLVRVVARIKALAGFLKTEDGSNLVAGFKRAANILRAEEKKDGAAVSGDVDAQLLAHPAEKALGEAMAKVEARLDGLLRDEDFEGTMAALAGLRGPVDAFFAEVLVNDPDAAVRANRLALLARMRQATRAVADFSRIEG